MLFLFSFLLYYYYYYLTWVNHSVFITLLPPWFLGLGVVYKQILPWLELTVMPLSSLHLQKVRCSNGVTKKQILGLNWELNLGIFAIKSQTLITLPHCSSTRSITLHQILIFEGTVETFWFGTKKHPKGSQPWGIIFQGPKQNV